MSEEGSHYIPVAVKLVQDKKTVFNNHYNLYEGERLDATRKRGGEVVENYVFRVERGVLYVDIEALELEKKYTEKERQDD